MCMLLADCARRIEPTLSALSVVGCFLLSTVTPTTAPAGLQGDPDPARRAAQSRRPATTKSVLVISLRSATQTPRCSNELLMAETFTDENSIRAYFIENSYGRASISGTVSGPYAIDVGSTCDLVGWANQGDAAAAAVGVNVGDYDSTVYILPPESNALSCIPGSSAVRRPGDRRGQRITIRENTCESKLSIAHELGHAFGVEHAGVSAAYVPLPVPDARQTRASQLMYGDLSSVMGGIFDGLVDPGTERAMFNALPHFTAPQKIHLGWLPAGNVQTVTEAGSYSVAVLATAVNDVQALRVIVGDSVFYVSYRRAVGFDSSLLSQYVDKTSVHTQYFRESTQQGGASTLHATLDDGHSYSEGRFTITQVRHDRSHAYVRISFPSGRWSK